MLQGYVRAGLILSILAVIRVFFPSRSDTSLEVLALRQQVAVLKRKRPQPRLHRLHRLLWTTLCHLWSGWADVLVIVKPETVVGWHRAGFRLYWRWRSRWRGGRPKITEEIHALIRGWLLRTQVGEPPRSTESFRSSASPSRKGP